KALAYLRGGGESTTLNCGYGRGYSVRELLKMVEKVAGHAIAQREAPRRAGDPPSLVARAARIRSTLGWQPRHDDLKDIVATSLPKDEAIAEELQRLMSSSKEVHWALRSRPANGTLDFVIDRFRVMNAAARDVGQRMRQLIDERLNDLEENTRYAQHALAWQSAALIPGTLVLVVLFLLLVGRPMRQVDRAIRELGEGDFTRPITVRGPNDIETLGRQLEWLRHRLKESADEK